MKLRSLVIACLFSGMAFAQQEANVWHFGSGKAIDFNPGNPVSLPPVPMRTFEGSSTVCDVQGNLLISTNGGGRLPVAGQDLGHIWNAANGVMYNMQGSQGGGFSAVQSSVIVKAPGQEQLYYVFTMEEREYALDDDSLLNAQQPLGRGLSYFTVDMSLNGGLGGVVQADQRIYVPSYEGLCAIRHTNQSDYWILINYDTTGIGVYRLTPAGINLTNVFPETSNSYSYIKASPNGQKVQRGNLMLDFNPSTGVLSNPTTLAYDFASGEFSPNSDFYFKLKPVVGFTYQIERYNIATNTVDNIVYTGTSPGESPGQMQLAPDGKIYYVTIDFISDSIFLNRISCPNTNSVSLERKVFSYYCPDTLVFVGLPNYPAWIFENDDSTYVAINADTLYLCEPGGTAVLSAQSSASNLVWSTGAGSQSIIVNAPGTYSVSVSGPCGSGSDTVVVLPCAQPVDSCANYITPDSVSVCSGDTLQLQINLPFVPPGTRFKWLGGNGTYLPSDTLAQTRYIPTANEVSQGSVRLVLEVKNPGVSSGKLIAYDHQGEDIIFYLSTTTGNSTPIQSNTGKDWTAIGFNQGTQILNGLSNIATPPALSNINLSNGVITEVVPYSDTVFYAGDYDNENQIFYAIGVRPLTGIPVQQILYRVNTSNGILTPVGNLNLTCDNGFFNLDGDGINGLAYDPDEDVLFGATQNGKLLRINPLTAAWTLVGNTVGDMRGLAYNYDANELWGINSTATLFKIDKLTGNCLDTVPCQQSYNFVTTLTYAANLVTGVGTTCYDTLHVRITPAATSLVTLSACSTYVWNGSTYTSSGTYSKMFPNGSSTGCDSIASINLNIYNSLNASIALIPGSCGLANANLTASANGGVGPYSFAWSNGASGAINAGLPAGNYSVIVSEPGNCKGNAQLTVPATAPANVLVNASDTSITAGDSVRIEVLYADNYTWTPDSGLSCTSCATVLAEPLQTTTYTIEGIDTLGCTYSRLVKIIVKPSEGKPLITVPNVFTPNGDSKNDVFAISITNAREVSIEIFDRWGKSVHVATLNGNFTGENRLSVWDGKDNSGKPLYDGVYYYLSNVVGFDGSNYPGTGFIHLMQGK